MPELPEVETVMRGLRGVLDGQVLSRAGTERAGLRWPFPAGLAERLRGAGVEGFRRRGKYMLMRLSGGDSALIHLGMSGRMVARRTNGPPLTEAFAEPATEPSTGLGPQGAASDARGDDPARHEHLWMETAHGWRVGFQDPRRFGCVDLVPTGAEDSHRLLAGMGPEPLDPGFTAAVLGAALAGRRTPVKASLLDQRVVAGLGNIYVSEALHRARISPLRLSGSLAPAEIRRLVPAIRAVLEEAIEAGGSSLRDYVRADGEVGHFQDRFRVYDRAGAPCPACGPRVAGAVVARVVQSGRSSFFCARCQV